MFLSFILLCAGLLMLYFGSEWLVDSSAKIALRLNIRPIIIGLTIVAFGTSAPELLVSLLASNAGASGLSIGNIIGSNVINIALVLGISAVLAPIVIKYQTVKNELAFLLGTSLLFWLLCFDGVLEKTDGLILLLTLVAFLIHNFLTSSDPPIDCYHNNGDAPVFKHALYICSGILLLGGGAHLVVNNAICIADYFNISDTFIGLTIVAFGTSLPELATSVVAARKKECDIAVGNIVGSNMFNICMVMGFVGVINPIHIDKGLHAFEFPFMLVLSALLALFIFTKNKITKKHGVFFLLLFIVYLTGSFLINGM